METEVLVVGAGPTGLMLAAELRRRGVDCRLVDALEESRHWDRATVAANLAWKLALFCHRAGAARRLQLRLSKE